MLNFIELSQAVVEGDTELTTSLTQKFLKAGIPVSDILNKCLIPGLREVGELFEDGKYYLPELIVSGDAVAEALEFLRPLMDKEKANYRGKYLICTVQGDVHDLGKNIVIMMLKGNGWQVTDLGVDVPPERICMELAEGEYHILGMSSLLTMTMPNVAQTIKTIEEAGLREKVKIMVGGAPTTPEWAINVGADAHAKDAPTAVKVAAELTVK